MLRAASGSATEAAYAPQSAKEAVEKGLEVRPDPPVRRQGLEACISTYASVMCTHDPARLLVAHLPHTFDLQYSLHRALGT